MIEVLFSESAAGSLKLAQSFGKGEMNVSSIGVIGHNEETAESNVRDFQSGNYSVKGEALKNEK